MMSRLRSAKRLLVDLPRQLRLAYCLMRDHRVPRYTKAAFGAALALIAYTNVASPKINQHISVRNCRFEGNFKKPVLLLPGSSAVQDLDWDKNTYKSSKDASASDLPKPK